jgi:20S proteasome subunit alpha 2
LPNKRIVKDTARKIERICSTIGITYSGIAPDFRQIVRFARKKASAYSMKFDENIPVNQLAKIIGEEMQSATQRGGVRPYGISILIIGFDHRG